MLEAIKSWEYRISLEKKRQGFYDNLEDAHNNGWLDLHIQVVGSYLNLSDPSQQSTEQIQSVFSWLTSGAHDGESKFI